MRRGVRIFVFGLLFHLKGMVLSRFFVGVSIVTPLILATLAFYMFRAGERQGTLLYAALGAGLMGVWSSTLFGSGGAIQWQRWQGTLELLVAAPAPFLLVLVPLTVSTATFGLVSLVATLLWGRLLFGVPFHVVHPLLFVVALPATVVALGLLGLLFASTFVLYRHANALSNLLDEVVWFVTGVLVPVSLLPGWVTPVSWLLAPTWGVRAIRGAVLGGENPPLAIGLCLALGAAYVALAAIFLHHFERLARDRAVLALA